MDSLAGQVQLGSDAIVAKQRDKDIGVCTCAADVSGDGHHLIDCHVIENRMHECIINEAIFTLQWRTVWNAPMNNDYGPDLLRTSY